MKVLVLDVETKVSRYGAETKHEIDGSPFNPDNYLVSCNWRKVEDGAIGENNFSIFKHNEYPIGDAPTALQEALDWADMVVGHNLKYDALYLLESGFRLPKRLYCTMIAEYILSRGVREELSLESTAIRRDVTRKKSDIISQYWDDGIGFEAIPLPIVMEYADSDVLSCAEIFVQQQNEWKETANLTLVNIVTLMNDMLDFLIEIERNGIMIDRNNLAKVKADYEAELEDINKKLLTIVEDVMGDTPINMNSGADVTQVVFSRKLVNRDEHIKLFNIGFNAKGKRLPVPYMNERKFSEAVRATTKVVYKTKAEHCERCKGTGYIRKYTKKGEPFKKENKCPACGGAGVIYVPTREVAGLKLLPLGPYSASVLGFSVAKDEIDLLIDQAITANNTKAVEFLTLKKRLNAVNVYLNSFVAGIERWTRSDGLLHPSFNQTVAKTGRLSSSDPNFQNQPKGKKFPIRKCVISRFKDGRIMECDFSGLEFVVAGELSRDPQIIEDILNGKDVHAQTARIVYQIDDTSINWKDGGKYEDMRSGVKPDTFAPLYGATGAGKPPHIKTYYEQFFNIYKRHGEWQVEQMNSVMARGFIRTPSGREYMFPGTKRIKGNRTTNATNIVNYPVQGFATGDIVPLACIRALRLFRHLKLRSKLILTVHDSIVADVHPDEIAIVHNVLKIATEGCPEEIEKIWDYKMALPLKSEVQAGVTWGNLEHIKVQHDNDNEEMLRKLVEVA